MKTSISIMLSVFVLLMCSLHAQGDDAGYLLSAAKYGVVNPETGDVSFLETRDLKVKQYGGGVSDSISFRMVRIAGGEFGMGQSGIYTAFGPVNVTVGNYWMCNTEVTQGLWEAVMDTVFVNVISDITCGLSFNHPVYFISWFDAIIFCNRLSVLLGKTPVYGASGADDAHKALITDMGYGNPKKEESDVIDSVVIDYSADGFRLPTEAEWEYAARGGVGGYGTLYAGTDSDNAGNDINVGGLGVYAWYNDNADGKSHEAGTKLPNGLGLFDMSGNIREWCNDWDIYPIDSGSVAAGIVEGVGPTGALTGTYRVLRGGGWNIINQSVSYCRVSSRDYGTPSIRNVSGGFRIVCPRL